MENLTMKKTVTTMLYGFGAVALLASGFAFAATIPADKAEMKISEIPGDQPAWPFVQTFRLYDPMNVLAAVPELARRFYDPERFEINGVTHRVIGRVRGNHCVHDPNDLRGALAHYIREALECSI